MEWWAILLIILGALFLILLLIAIIIVVYIGMYRLQPSEVCYREGEWKDDDKLSKIKK